MISFIKDMVYHSVHFNSPVHNVHLGTINSSKLKSDFLLNYEI